MKKITEILLVVLLIFISSCAVNRLKHDQKKILYENMALWNDFEIEGMTQIVFKEFNLHKNIVIKNNSDSLQAVIFESGIFGSKPLPFADIVIKDSLYIKSSILRETIVYDDIDHKKILPDFDSREIDLIIENRKLETKQYTAFFNDKFQLIKISFKENAININIEYGLDDLPKSITGFSKNTLIFKLEIDKFNT